MTATRASSDILSQISKLSSAREKLDRKLSSLRKKAQSDRPWNLCLRCGFRWQGLWLDRSPRYCARCHSAGWNIHPVLGNSRKPTDPPNPNWGRKKQAKAVPPSVSVSVPVPMPAELVELDRTEQVWMREQVVEDYLSHLNIPPIGLPPPPALDTGLPPLPRLDEPMGEEFARPTLAPVEPEPDPEPEFVPDNPPEQEESHEPDPDPEPSA